MEIITPELKDELLKKIDKKYGFDFSNYSEASIIRRITRFYEMFKFNNTKELAERLTTDKKLFELFVTEITVNVTQFFREPGFYKSLITKVFPVLSTYPFIKIWCAGCSTGQEVYSLAILLKEAGLTERIKIYATDLNTLVIKKAKDGIYSKSEFEEGEAGYKDSGGKMEFKNYFTESNSHYQIKDELKKNLVFAQHNLVKDESFNEFNLIMCRNVLIYFNLKLQDHVLKLFDNSMRNLGYLGLGSKESLSLSKIGYKYEVIDSQEKIYRKIH